MAAKFTLVTRSETLRKPTFLSYLLMNQQDRENIYNTQVLVPERCLFECYNKLSGAEFNIKEIKDCTLACDEVFTDFPILFH